MDYMEALWIDEMMYLAFSALIDGCPRTWCCPRPAGRVTKATWLMTRRCGGRWSYPDFCLRSAINCLTASSAAQPADHPPAASRRHWGPRLASKAGHAHTCFTLAWCRWTWEGAYLYLLCVCLCVCGNDNFLRTISIWNPFTTSLYVFVLHWLNQSLNWFAYMSTGWKKSLYQIP